MNDPAVLINKQAIKSLIFGLTNTAYLVGIILLNWHYPTILCFSFTLLPFVVLMSILGIMAGYQARLQIKESMGNQAGSGMAVVGILLCYINLVMSFLLFMSVFL